MARFICIDDGVPLETHNLLRTACEHRNVAFQIIDAAGFDYLPERRLTNGDLLYCPAISQRAAAVECFLFGPGIVSLRSDPLGPFVDVAGTPTLFERQGLPVPRNFTAGAAAPELLRLFVDELGGGSGGIGVMLADNMPALKSLLEFLLAKGVLPSVSSYVHDAVCWRIIVLGDRALAACRNPIRDGDFRSGESPIREDYFSEIPGELASLAISAVKSLRIEFAGVDILEHKSGRLYLLEANFPCYFAPADLVGNLGVSGALVDYMLAKYSRFEHR
jgi:hypothetical protein